MPICSRASILAWRYLREEEVTQCPVGSSSAANTRVRSMTHPACLRGEVGAAQVSARRQVRSEDHTPISMHGLKAMYVQASGAMVSLRLAVGMHSTHWRFWMRKGAARHVGSVARHARVHAQAVFLNAAHDVGHRLKALAAQELRRLRMQNTSGAAAQHKTLQRAWLPPGCMQRTSRSEAMEGWQLGTRAKV